MSNNVYKLGNYLIVFKRLKFLIISYKLNKKIIYVSLKYIFKCIVYKIFLYLLFTFEIHIKNFWFISLKYFFFDVDIY